MPLIVITGIPCSGKTTRSLELKKYFENKLKSNGQNVEIINECDAITKVGYDKNTFYAGQSGLMWSQKCYFSTFILNRNN